MTDRKPAKISAGGELSLYEPGPLSDRAVIEVVNDLRHAFPGHGAEFWSLLVKAFEDAGFNDERMRDAANNVIKTCEYPLPTIARFTTFDKTVRVYSYREMFVKCANEGFTTDDFEMIVVNGKKVWKMK